MFKTDAEYIVAGEIIRTARMYASSVSPLSAEVLQRLSPELFRRLSAQARLKKEQGAKLAPFKALSDQLQIANEKFELKTIKGHRFVFLPWPLLSKILDKIGEPSEYRKLRLRGVILLPESKKAGEKKIGEKKLLYGEKLSLILSLAPALKEDIDRAFSTRLPETRSFASTPAEIGALVDALPLLLKPAVHGKKKSDELGFIGLYSNNNSYYFRCVRGFNTALNESLASLETLIDDIGDSTSVESHEIDIDKRNIINQTYRRLSDYLD
jgi:hypothetical protein